MTVQIRAINEIDTKAIIAQTKYADVPGAEKSLWYCFNMSASSWIGLIDEKVACVWGLIPPSLLSDKAYFWLLTTELVDQHKFIFIRQSQIFLERALGLYPTIVGHVELGNDKAIRWLRWLGAKFEKPSGKRMPFEIVRK